MPLCVGAANCTTSRDSLKEVDDLLKLDIHNLNLREEMPIS